MLGNLDERLVELQSGQGSVGKLLRDDARENGGQPDLRNLVFESQDHSDWYSASAEEKQRYAARGRHRPRHLVYNLICPKSLSK